MKFKRLTVTDTELEILKFLLTDYKKGLEFAVEDDTTLLRQCAEVNAKKYTNRLNSHYQTLCTCNCLIDAIDRASLK